MLVIRKAVFADLESIASLHAQSWRDNYNEVLSADYLDKKVFAERKAVWTARFSNPQANQLVLVAEVDGAFCGFVCVLGAHHPKFGTIIDNLHVKADTKGLGIGSGLLSAAASWSIANYSGHDVYLEVLACNSKAMSFYLAKGAKNIDISYWHTACGNKVKEFIYSWGAPENLANGLAKGSTKRVTENVS